MNTAMGHPNTILILSGGKGEGEDVSEASIMYDYLKDKGVPEHQMLKEEQSESTYENLVYSKLLIDAREAERRRALERLLGESGLHPPAGKRVVRTHRRTDQQLSCPKSQSNRQKHRLYQRGKRQRPLPTQSCSCTCAYANASPY